MITYQQEFLPQVEKDIKPLIRDHWVEVGHTNGIPLDPDWEKYASLEEIGKLKIFTARDSDKLVGYFIFFVDYHLHHKDFLYATHDIFFVLPEYRQSTIAIKLLMFSEKYLYEDGVQFISINTTIKKPFDSILEKFDYDFIERVYLKCLPQYQ